MGDAIEAIREWRRRNLAALWIAPACSPETAAMLLSLDWPVVWTALAADGLEQTLSSMRGRYQLIRSRNHLPPEGRSAGLRFLYDVSRGSGLVQGRRAAELENLLDGWAGAIVVGGEMTSELRELIEAFAPTNEVYELGSPAGPPELLDVAQVVGALVEDERSAEAGLTLDLKDASGVPLDSELLEPLRDAWQLLTRDVVHPSGRIVQQDLDDFLSGDASWRALAAGAAADRGRICQSDTGSVDLASFVLRTIREADRRELDPSEAVRRVRLFAETGSGCTTLLRQAALAVARAGYPVLMTRPLARSLLPLDVARLVVHVQDAWAVARSGKGSGAGTLPFCLVLDADVELAFQAESFARTVFTELNRKLVIITAHRRARDEIGDAHGVVKLRAKTSKDEILKLGKTLREFSARWSLAPIPDNPEWEAYYASFGRLKTHLPLPRGSLLETPALFLIGLYPFVKARVRDERSLSRYLYQRWASIEDVDRRRLIEILAVAAAYECAVPLECLRDNALMAAATSFASKADERAADLFVEWATFGNHTANWALHMRHPGLGILLVRAILPQEAQAPCSPLLTILEQLVGTNTDIWFAEQFAYRLGRHFQSEAQQFSLVSDTPIQSASRRIFGAIPDNVESASRVVCHHHARYYVHLLHACLRLLDHPDASPLAPAALRATAFKSIAAAEALLDKGRAAAHGRERVSNLLNTLAAASLRIAEVLIDADRPTALEYYNKATELAGEAIADNMTNGHAIFTYVRSIQKLFTQCDVEEIGATEAIDLFNRAESRIQTLLQLKDSQLWRNIEDEDAEIQVSKLIEDHNALAHRLDRSPLVKALVLKTPGARAAIALREILQQQKLADAFQSPTKAAKLRALRKELRENSATYRDLQDLEYRLYCADPVDRFDYTARYALLDRIALALPDEYPAYLHDHAAVAFQLDQVDRAEELFEQIRRTRIHSPNFWTWHNERILIEKLSDGRIQPREVVVRISDPIEGWAIYLDRIRVKIQPRQWGDLKAGAYQRAYLRFRLAGPQAVDKRLAAYDLATMGVQLVKEGARA
jgi:hypothetical protein